MYTLPLSTLIGKFSVSHRLYADDTQIYLSFSSCDSDTSISSLKRCLQAVQDWMYHNRLKLNPDKTEFLLIGNKVQRAKFSDMFPVDLMGSCVSPSSSARNLGIVFDENLSWKKHINTLCRNCYYHIRDLRRIRKHLDLKVSTGLANALVSSKLDYCNSLYFAASGELVGKLQRVQNCLARVVTGSSKYASSSTLLNNLHWLPIQSRIAFKINLITYKVLNRSKPIYLANLLHYRKYDINLKSNDTSTLKPGPKIRTNYGRNSFASSSPFLWNMLPDTLHTSSTITVFKKQLKTYYFNNPAKLHPAHHFPP